MHNLTLAAGQLSIRDKLLATLLFAFAALWFLFMSGILRTALSPQADRGFWIFAAGYLLVAAAAGCVVLLVSRADDRPLSKTIVWSGLGVSSTIALAILVSIWNFDLDDKWVYYRVSENVLSSGLPLWNLNEHALVGASFFYPYLLSIGHFFGGPLQWSNYEKVIAAMGARRTGDLAYDALDHRRDHSLHAPRRGQLAVLAHVGALNLYSPRCDPARSRRLYRTFPAGAHGASQAHRSRGLFFRRRFSSSLPSIRYCSAFRSPLCFWSKDGTALIAATFPSTAESQWA
jgi:hypothetical protein